MNFLLRDQAPLTPDEWQAIDAAVTEAARGSLVCRRFVPLYGPLGPGAQSVPDDRYEEGAAGGVDLLGDSGGGSVRLSVRRFLPLPLIYKDFVLAWRDIELSRQFHTELDTSGAVGAAQVVAQTEDDLIVNGNPALELPGLRTAEGVNRLPLGDWSQPNEAFGAVVRATETLVEQSFNGPYTVLVGPLLYAQLNRMFDNSGLLALEQVQKLARGGVEQSPVVPGAVALVLQASPDTVDLAVGLDVITAYLGPDNLNHACRVLESAVLRIKQPRAIAVLEGAGERGRRG